MCLSLREAAKKSFLVIGPLRNFFYFFISKIKHILPERFYDAVKLLCCWVARLMCFQFVTQSVGQSVTGIALFIFWLICQENRHGKFYKNRIFFFLFEIYFCSNIVSSLSDCIYLASFSSFVNYSTLIDGFVCFLL